MTRFTRSFPLIMASVIAGCHSSTAPQEKSTVSGASAANEAYAAAESIPDSEEGQPDRAFLAVQHDVPGFGGLFIDRDGTPTVYLTDTTQRAAIAGRVASMLSGVSSAHSTTIRIRQGAYDWRTLKVWQRMADAHLITSGRVAFTDADESVNRLVIGVVDSSASAYVMNAVTHLGIPAQGVQTIIAQAPTPTSAPVSVLKGFVRPLIPGIRTISMQGNGHLQECSIGFITNGFGSAVYRGFLTASHCTNNPSGPDSTKFDQPSYWAHEISNFKTVDPPWPFDLLPRMFYQSPTCRRSDIALMAIEDSVSSTFAEVASVTHGDTIAATPYDVVSTDYDAVHVIVGDTMAKVGESTGYTSGVISRTGITTFENVVLPTGQTYPECLSQQVAVVVAKPPAAESGDSGSPVFANRGFPEIEAEGIVWGVALTNAPNDTYLFSTINGFKTDAGGVEPVLH